MDAECVWASTKTFGIVRQMADRVKRECSSTFALLAFKTLSRFNILGPTLGVYNKRTHIMLKAVLYYCLS